MPIPKFYEVMLPLLNLHKDGKEHDLKDMIEPISDLFNLTQEERSEKVSGGWSRIDDRIGWARTYLKKGGLLSSSKRRHHQITARGKIVLEKNLDILTPQMIVQMYPDVLKDKFYNPNLRIKKTEIEAMDYETPKDSIQNGITQIENQTKSDLLEKLRSVNPYLFETIILNLLNKMGYGETISTKKSGDGGIDGVVNQDKLGLEKIYIQAKRYTENKVREPEIRNFIGAMSGDTTKGVFVTTSEFDISAINKAKEAHHKIILIDGSKLVDLMYQYGIGVQVTDCFEIKEIDLDFFER